LCYSSTLYVTLKPEWYPWPNLGPGSVSGGFSPGVVVFKDDLDHDCVELPKEERSVVSVITVAAPRYPRLTTDREHFVKESDLEDLRGKIRVVYRMAAHNKQRYLILGKFINTYFPSIATDDHGISRRNGLWCLCMSTEISFSGNEEYPP
jgi:hypothetical protein